VVFHYTLATDLTDGKTSKVRPPPIAKGRKEWNTCVESTQLQESIVERKQLLGAKDVNNTEVIRCEGGSLNTLIFMEFSNLKTLYYEERLYNGMGNMYYRIRAFGLFGHNTRVIKI
jgi:hypothetical protein